MYYRMSPTHTNSVLKTTSRNTTRFLSPISPTYYVIIVLGLDCRTTANLFEKLKNYLIEEIRLYSYFNESNIEIMCDYNQESAVYDFAKNTICRTPLKDNNKFVLKVMENIQDKHDKYDFVYIIGYSYGGSVVCKIAELYNKAYETGDDIIYKQQTSVPT